MPLLLLGCRPVPQATSPQQAAVVSASKDAETRQQFRLVWRAPEPQVSGGQLTRPEISGELLLPAVLPGETWLVAWDDQMETLFKQLEERRPQAVRFVPLAEGWVAQAQTGWQVDREATRVALQAAVKEGRHSAEVVLKLTAPDGSARWAQAQGLTHLATGETTFTGSPEFRVHNIVTGAGRLDQVWLAPGQTFNFNRLIGPINARTGFKPGYVISGGSLATEDGGGICQVSTTAFRAALYAGLPITERHAHSHQVAYYGEPGLDAAVYAPSKNLRFVNDTGGPLLVQAEWDTKAERLQIHLFGRHGGRQVKVGQPQQSRVRPAGEPQFLADPDLPSGAVQRIDMPAPGASVSVTREIRDEQGRVRRETFRSSYRPWGGAFAVSPDDARLREQ